MINLSINIVASSPNFFARKDTKTPVLIGAGTNYNQGTSGYSDVIPNSNTQFLFLASFFII